jgi:hypothetical protein
MKKVNLFASTMCVAVALTLGGVTPQATGGLSFPVFPNYFPPFDDTGMIIEISADGGIAGGETCIVFMASSNGALYFFDGVDAFAPGTFLHVKGNLCLICLVATTCDQPVSPILNAKVEEI